MNNVIVINISAAEAIAGTLLSCVLADTVQGLCQHLSISSGFCSLNVLDLKRMDFLLGFLKYLQQGQRMTMNLSPSAMHSQHVLLMQNVQKNSLRTQNSMPIPTNEGPIPAMVACMAGCLNWQ
ncbi:hypothetical protein CEXT_597381 [Caerostris extrusa]|uniref:Uncharacterized protein n=1 Tax=Caerostris extrusa TaxID=172846 RepID=A0AAV4SDP5_CAEEX|nr:hypothetical protein CEXT_44571 [Caerostris extrusa]GIY76700.1 hypothetical protein CEXT_597381 [Caerostris extrusa]